MNIINAIIKSFRGSAHFSNDGEVDLFRKLAKSICSYSNSTFIDETHGKVAQVKFNSRINGVDQCEISDLLIISKDQLSRNF